MTVQQRSGPLTVAQEQLWALQHRTPMPAALNLSYALAIAGPLDVAALAAAFRDLIHRHAPLRTAYPRRAGRPVAEVADEEFGLTAINLSPGPVLDSEDAALLAQHDRVRSFDLAAQSPIRAELHRLGDGRHLLLISLHHIVVDGWSLQLICQFLTKAYQTRLRGEAPPETTPRTDLLEYAREQRTWLRGDEATQETTWWVERLRDATTAPPMLPAPRRDLGVAMRRQVVALPVALADELRTLGRKANVSMFTLLLTAAEALLARHGVVEPVLGTLVANRPTAASSQLLGAHYNALLLNTRLDGDPSFAEVLLRTSARTVRALDRQRLPHAVLAPVLERELGWPPGAAPRVMLLMDPYPMAALNVTGCEVTGLYLDDRADPDRPGGQLAAIPTVTDADLTLFVREVGQRLTLTALYPHSALADSAVAGLVEGYLEVLAALCEAPELGVADLMLPTVEPLDRDTGSARATLRAVDRLAPVDALSPVGCWAPVPAEDG